MTPSEERAQHELYLSEHDVVSASETGVNITLGWDDYYGSAANLTWGQATELAHWILGQRGAFGLTENVR